ncbi:MAG: hypothetical protein F6K00_24705 [Leptolyngbya sp. SIOISBB]|nr:hypothetical protein [Leptolyngbya sp. SIOISBB]
MSYLFWKRAIVTLAVMPFASLCLICIFWGFIIGKVYSLNNQILSEYEQVFRETAHPPDTSKVASKRLVTRPPGNGSHCFYFVGEVRSFSGDQARIKDFYTDSQIQLQLFENGQLNRFPYDWLSQLTNWEISKASSRDSYYLIYILNSKINDYTSLDLRCS